MMLTSFVFLALGSIEWPMWVIVKVLSCNWRGYQFNSHLFNYYAVTVGKLFTPTVPLVINQYDLWQLGR